MKNVKMQVQGNKLILEIDLKQEFGKSSSQKSVIVASSEGNVVVPCEIGGLKLGVNVYKPAEK